MPFTPKTVYRRDIENEEISLDPLSTDENFKLLASSFGRLESGIGGVSQRVKTLEETKYPIYLGVQCKGTVTTVGLSVSGTATITSISGGTATMTNIYATLGTITSLYATTATITSLSGGTATLTNISGTTATLTDIYATGNVIVPKTSGKGIKVDTASPTFGWRDLLGDIKTRPAAGGGAAALPDYVAYRGSIYGYRFGTNAPNNHEHEAFVEYHIPHDYVPGSDLFLHLHWSQIVVDTGGAAGVPGVSEWFWDVTYAKGYGTAGGAADPFIAPITTTCTQQGSTTQYGHMICEVQLSATTPSASQLDSDNIEVDGLLLVRVYRDPGSANDTLDQDTFVHFCDVHYQSTNMATKDKNTPFYT